MGEYADIQIREDMRRMFGFDPGDMSEENNKPRKKKPRVNCSICGAHVEKQFGLKDHMKAKHGIDTPKGEKE